MKDISLSQLATKLHFKRLTVEDLKRGGSFRLVDDEGNFVAMVMVPLSAAKRAQLEALASQMNAALGKD